MIACKTHLSVFQAATRARGRSCASLLLVLAAALPGAACSDGVSASAGAASFEPPPLECPEGAVAEKIVFSENQIDTRIEKAEVGLRCTLPDGRRHGPSMEWYASGQVAGRTEWWQGEKHGRFEMWYPSGQKRAEGEHRSYLPHGVWTYWEPDGKVMQRRDFGDEEAAADSGASQTGTSGNGAPGNGASGDGVSGSNDAASAGSEEQPSGQLEGDTAEAQ